MSCVEKLQLTHEEGYETIEGPRRGYYTHPGTIRTRIPMSFKDIQTEPKETERTFKLKEDEVERIKRLKQTHKSVTSVITDPITNETIVLVGIRKNEVRTLDRGTEIKEMKKKLDLQDRKYNN